MYPGKPEGTHPSGPFSPNGPMCHRIPGVPGRPVVANVSPDNPGSAPADN